MSRVDLLKDGLIRFPDEAPSAEDAELAAWRQTAEATGRELPEPPATRANLGACALCGNGASVGTCAQCGRAACREEFWTMLGLCRQCLPEDEVAAAREHRREPPADLGIKWVGD